MIIYFIHSKLELFYTVFKILFINLVLFSIDLRIYYIYIKSNLRQFSKNSKSEPEFKPAIHVNNAFIQSFCTMDGEYLTLIAHSAFNEGSFVVVAEYENETEAKTGHEYWIQKFKQGLPNELKDVIDGKVYKRVFVDHKEDDDYELYFD